jgi:membrane protease YdiL (CAAX protease family)
MKDSITLQEKIGELLRTNKFAIFLEIAVVVVPLYATLMISDRLGSDVVPLGGNLVLLGGPLAYLGLALSLAAVWVASRMRGVSWGEFGLTRQKSWVRTVLMSLGVALAFFVGIVMLVNPLIRAIPNIGPRDMSRFDHLRGNLPNLIINLVAMWFTAGFVEEFLWRGYLMTRLVDLLGKQTKLAWVIALVGSAVIFGLGHPYQDLAGMVRVGAAGLLLGVAFLTVGRNLWPLMIAHALIDTLDFVGHYFGG